MDFKKQSNFDNNGFIFNKNLYNKPAEESVAADDEGDKQIVDEINQQDSNLEEEPKNENKGKIKLLIENKEYELETNSYIFNYPERIQKETGIIGYERIRISTDSLFNVIKNELAQFLDERGIGTKEEFIRIYEGFLEKEYGPYSEEKRQEPVLRYKEHGRILNIIEKILLVLSNEEYPYNCYTHVMGGYAGGSSRMTREFKEDKFFLQKIYPQERMKKNDTNYGWGNIGSWCSLYKHDGTLLNSDYNLRAVLDLNKETPVFAAQPKTGLNFQIGKFWSGEHESQDIRSMHFGIPMIADSFQEEYIKKTLDIFLKIEKKEVEKGVSDKKGIWGVLAMHVFNEFKKRNPKFLFPQRLNGFNTPGNRRGELFKKEDLEKFYEVKEKCEKEMGEIVNDFLIKNNLKPFGQSAVNRLSFHWEVHLPIFFNHQELPQISWGYAKYAHYFNKKGLNFFKLNHADHLPQKD